MARSIRALEILPPAHACTHTALSEIHSSIVSAEHRQATHEHMSNVDINGQARSQTQAHELSGSLTPCEDAQNQRRHPDRSRTKKIVSVSQTVLSTAKPLSTCNYTSNNGRWMRGLEILPPAHMRTNTHKHTALSEVHRSVVGAEPLMST